MDGATTDASVLPDSRAQEIYQLLYTLRASHNVRAGFNEALKAINGGMAHLVVGVADAEPPELIAPLSEICARQGVPYVVVPSKSALGKACRLETDTMAAVVVTGRNEDSKRVLEQIRRATKS